MPERLPGALHIELNLLSRFARAPNVASRPSVDHLAVVLDPWGPSTAPTGLVAAAPEQQQGGQLQPRSFEDVCRRCISRRQLAEPVDAGDEVEVLVSGGVVATVPDRQLGD